MARVVPGSIPRTLAAIAATLTAACAADVVSPRPDASTSQFAFEQDAVGFSFSDWTSFVPAASSAACTVGGGVSQVELPIGFTSAILARLPAYPDVPDMLSVNETGPNAGRYLYATHETGANSAVSVTDLVTGETRTLAQRADWERFDGIVWTPWGTILAAEETSAHSATGTDPDFPDAIGGLVYEIDPTNGSARARPALGAKSHEGMRFDRLGNHYGISERGPGYVYKFVPDRMGDLSEGQLYALRITEDSGDRTGWGTWVALDRVQSRINADVAAEAVGATGYSRPEDVEIATSTGVDRRGGSVMYIAVTGEDRVLAIDLMAGTGARVGQVLVSDFVREGVNAPVDFDLPDNLALDRDGNLLISEDPGGSAPAKTRGDDVWLARFDRANPSRSFPIVRFFSITDCQAEPTGIYFSRSGRTLFVNIQHRGGDGTDLTLAIQRFSGIGFLRADARTER